MERKLWKDRIGETKTVEGFVFTLYELEGKKVWVEVNNDLELVNRDVWKRGVFSKIIKRLKPKFVGETKDINGILFKVLESAKNRFKVVAEGFDGVIEMAKDTWKKGRFYKNAMKKLVSKCRSLAITEEDQYKKECEKLMQLDDCRAFQGCTNMADIKRTYKRLARIYHPDCGGTKQQFERLQIIYREAVAAQNAYDMIAAKYGL